MTKGDDFRRTGADVSQFDGVCCDDPLIEGGLIDEVTHHTAAIEARESTALAVQR